MQHTAAASKQWQHAAQTTQSQCAYSCFQSACCHMDGAATVCRPVASKANSVQAAVGSQGGDSGNKAGLGMGAAAGQRVGSRAGRSSTQ